MFHRRLEASDPILVSIIENKQMNTKKSKGLPDAIKKMLYFNKVEEDVGEEVEKEDSDSENESDGETEKIYSFDYSLEKVDNVVLEEEFVFKED